MGSIVLICYDRSRVYVAAYSASRMITVDLEKDDMQNTSPIIHPTADVSPRATIGDNVRIWHHAQVREGARIGDNCIIGKDVYIDFDVSVGANSKLQNGVYVYHGVTVEDGVFLGPGVILTNDRLPRAINPDGSLKAAADWQVSPILVRRGASIGAGAVVLPGITVGEFAMVGAGAVVTRDIPAHRLAYGNPARLHDYVCSCGQILAVPQSSEAGSTANVSVCPTCGQSYQF
jgi:UDP-2-acetamido-3-amino-2,3-dideoxy-glucuronate N-acetyltransferase